MYMEEVITKTCSSCGLEKDISEFKKKHGKCHPCLKQYKADFYQKNKERYDEESKKRYERIKNTEEFKKQKRAYSKKYRQTEAYKERRRKYQKSDKEKARRNRRRKERRATDPKYKLSERIGISICDALKGRKMGRKWETLVGYTVDDLKNHLESLWEPWMSWENHGVYKPNGPRTWHIDHVIPQGMFNYTNPEDEEFKLCWSLNNLQPKCSKTNIIKKNHYIG